VADVFSAGLSRSLRQVLSHQATKQKSANERTQWEVVEFLVQITITVRERPSSFMISSRNSSPPARLRSHQTVQPLDSRYTDSAADQGHVGLGIGYEDVRIDVLHAEDIANKEQIHGAVLAKLSALPSHHAPRPQAPESGCMRSGSSASLAWSRVRLRQRSRPTPGG
jgi:hypothetical protein